MQKLVHHIELAQLTQESVSDFVSKIQDGECGELRCSGVSLIIHYGTDVNDIIEVHSEMLSYISTFNEKSPE